MLDSINNRKHSGLYLSKSWHLLKKVVARWHVLARRLSIGQMLSAQAGAPSGLQAPSGLHGSMTSFCL